MKFITAIILLILVPMNAFSGTTIESEKEFGVWKVIIEVDDFEGEAKPTLKTEISAVGGGNIGTAYIYPSLFQNKFQSAFLSLDACGLDPTWPECDYKYTKFKIDDSKGTYFPTEGSACPSLTLRQQMVSRFKHGKTFRFSARYCTGIIDLTGFTKAWNYALGEAKRKR